MQLMTVSDENGAFFIPFTCSAKSHSQAHVVGRKKNKQGLGDIGAAVARRVRRECGDGPIRAASGGLADGEAVWLMARRSG